MKIDYEVIFKRSFEITKKYKWLLIYGLLIAGSGGTSGIRGISNSASDLFDAGSENLQPNDFQNIPTKTTQVLGETTNIFVDWLSSVNPFTWILLGLTFLAIVVITITVSLIIKNWAKGALISGIDMTLKKEHEVTLKSTSPKGINSTKNLIILSMLNVGFSFLIFIIVPLTGILIHLLLNDIPFLGTLWIILASITGVLALILGVIMISMIGVYAERLITLQQYSPFQAWKKGLSLSKGNFLRTLLMGILNMVLSTLIGCLSTILALIVMGIPALILLLPNIRTGTFPHPIVLLILIMFFLMFIIFNMLVRAVVVVFKFSNWNQFFNIVIEHTEEVQTNG